MTHHHDALINIPLGAIVLFMPWWQPALESTSWLAGKLVPIGGLILVILQITLMVRKLRRR